MTLKERFEEETGWCIRVDSPYGEIIKQNAWEFYAHWLELKMPRRTERELLEAYSEWLEKHSYMDTDWWAEEPGAIDRFMEEAIDHERNQISRLG